MDNVSMQAIQLLQNTVGALNDLRQAVEKDLSTQFDDLFSAVSNRNQAHVENVWSTKGEDVSAKPYFDSTAHAERFTKQEEKSRLTREDAKRAVDGIDQAAKEIKDEIKDLFDVTEDEIEAAMQALGLSNADLIQVSNLAELLGSIKEELDGITLLGLSDFASLVDDVKQLGSELLTELKLEGDVSELPDFYENAMTLLESMDAEEVLEAEFASLVEEAMKDTESRESMVSLSEVGQTASEEESVESVSAKEEEGILSENEQEDSFAFTREMPSETESNDAGAGFSFRNERRSADLEAPQAHQGEAEQAQVQQVTQTTEINANGQVVTETVTHYIDPTKAMDLISQISSRASVMVSEDVSSIELQLSPASLGSINLNITSKAGVISAQLSAENEAVKMALEAQVEVLKDNLNAQGLKVESIEVTVSSHAFERNLEQNAHSEEQRQNGEERKGVRRGLRMDGLSELQGLMSEEETLLAKMMAEQGNTMDLTA